MANEAVTIELLGYPPGEPIQYTVANGTSISGGTLLSFVDPRTAQAASASGAAGIAAADKLASDGATTLAVYTKGIFDCWAGGAGVNAGALLVISGANQLKLATEADTVTGAIFGRALESATATGEVIAVELMV